MDNVIAGIIGLALFLAFAFGLAQSIGALPFFIIVSGVAVLALIDLWQSVRRDLPHRNAGTGDGDG